MTRARLAPTFALVIVGAGCPGGPACDAPDGSSDGSLSSDAGGPPPCLPGATDCWRTISDVDEPRWSHLAFWTGSGMIVCAGESGFAPDAPTCSVYDPINDNWTTSTKYYGIDDRRWAAGVWTGSEILLWGGEYGGNYFADGARYEPATDTWRPMADPGLTPRRESNAVWTGSEMILFGGHDFDTGYPDGGRYDPAADAWSPINTADAPSAWYTQTAVWTGTEMIVWPADGPTPTVAGGGRYDPALDSWVPVSSLGAPSLRCSHTAVWTGAEMIVWGGEDLWGPLATGGRYDPVTDAWIPTSPTGAPAARAMAEAVWTGDEMIVWGGFETNILTFTNRGGRYAPATDTWRPTTEVGAPSPTTFGFSAVWTGEEMIVWGASAPASGGRYVP